MSGDSISAVIPVLNEQGRVGAAIASAFAAGAQEVIVVDGGSADATVARATASGARVIQSERGRGIQLHAGAMAAQGDILLFLHADALLPPVSENEILTHLCRYHAGYFRLCFDDRSLPVRLVAWAANLRSSLLSLPYGDQALFLRRSLYQEIGGFRNYPFLEDLDFVRRLRKKHTVRGLPNCVTISARRLRKAFPLAPIIVSLRNVCIALLFVLGVQPGHLIRFYR